jgi:transcriptional regulator with XRE-family HTH domain
MDVNSSPQRLKFIILSLKTNGLRFAKIVGVSQPFISSILSGRSKISRSLLEKISKHYPEINTHWLLTGEGSAFIEPDQVGVKTELKFPDHPPAVQVNFLNDQDLRQNLAQNLNFIVTTFNLKKIDLFRHLMAEVSKQTITNYFNGSSQMPLSALIALEDFTGVAIKTLLTKKITSNDLESLKI